jgi:hypothetical protein
MAQVQRVILLVKEEGITLLLPNPRANCLLFKKPVTRLFLLHISPSSPCFHFTNQGYGIQHPASISRFFT